MDGILVKDGVEIYKEQKLPMGRKKKTGGIMIVDKRLNNLADAYCRANNREFKYLWLKKIMEYMRRLNET